MNKLEIDSDLSKVPKKNRWFAGYIIAGIIWYASRGFNKTSYDGLVIGIIAILCGYFYHRLKYKIKIKNGFVRIVVTFLILEIIAGFSIGVLTDILDRITRF